jgi:hypothetical protein
MVRQLVVIPADQDETRQVAAMGLQEEGFENRYPEAEPTLMARFGRSLVAGNVTKLLTA